MSRRQPWWVAVLKFLGMWGEPAPAPVPTPAPVPGDPPVAPITPQPETDAWTQARFWTCPDSVRTWPIVSSLTVEIRGSRLYLTTDKPALWPNIDGTIGNICCLLFREGKWQAGPIDGMRPFQQNGGDRSVKCGAVPSGDDRLYEAIKGEQVGFVVTGHCRRGQHMKPQQRTAVGWVTWK